MPFPRVQNKTQTARGSPRDEEVNVVDFRILVRFKSRSCINFRTNTIGKSMDSCIPQLWVKYYH